MGSEDPIAFINAETNRIPFKNHIASANDWQHSFRSWPSHIAGWRDWYRRVSAAKAQEWEELGIGHCINLSLADMEKNETLLASASYLWSDALNAFLFNNGPITPTLMDVVMLTDLDVTTSCNPWGLRANTTHRLPTKDAGGWRGYMTLCRQTGTVQAREHVAFLNMWLERFVFCGRTIGPTTNFQAIAERLAQGDRLPLGRYLLGATYHLLHEVSMKLSAGQPVGNIGGPWWFLQLWMATYYYKAMGVPPLQTNTFPADYAEGEEPVRRRCTSMGEAASAVRGDRLSDELLTSWFRSLYIGFNSENTVRFPYQDMSDFEIPFTFRPDAPMADALSSQIFEACIRPCLLPVGIGSGRTHRPSYEFYHPSVGARQMGLGQLPIGLYFINKIRARQPIEGALAFDRVMRLGEDLPLGTCPDIFLTPSSSRLFTQWWGEWKKHLFWANPARYTTVADSDDEVQSLSSLPFIGF